MISSGAPCIAWSRVPQVRLSSIPTPCRSVRLVKRISAFGAKARVRRQRREALSSVLVTTASHLAFPLGNYRGTSSIRNCLSPWGHHRALGIVLL